MNCAEINSRDFFFSFFFQSKYFHWGKTSLWPTYKWFHTRFFQMDLCILLKSPKPDTVDWRARPPFVSCFRNPHRSSLFQGCCRWIAGKPFPEASRPLDKRCFHLTTSGRRCKEGLQTEPFEITVLMKHEKLQALRCDFTSTREQRGGPPPGQIRREGAVAVSGHTHTHTIWNPICVQTSLNPNHVLIP